jgi:hypothetical protein
VPSERDAATILPCVYSLSWGRKRNFGAHAADFEGDLAATLEKLQRRIAFTSTSTPR